MCALVFVNIVWKKKRVIFCFQYGKDLQQKTKIKKGRCKHLRELIVDMKF